MSKEMTKRAMNRMAIHLWELQLFSWSSVRQHRVVFRCLLAFSSFGGAPPWDDDLSFWKSISIFQFSWVVTESMTRRDWSYFNLRWAQRRRLSVCSCGCRGPRTGHNCSKKVATQCWSYSRWHFICRIYTLTLLLNVFVTLKKWLCGAMQKLAFFVSWPILNALF